MGLYGRADRGNGIKSLSRLAQWGKLCYNKLENTARALPGQEGGAMENKNRAVWLYLLPAILFLGVFMIYPLIDVCIYSLEEGYNSASQTFFGVGGYNYSYVLHDPYFLQAVKNTFILVIFTVPISTGLALLISVGLASIKRLRELFRTAYEKRLLALHEQI
jgi:ABC-type maltose transport system permease subunit